MPTVVSCRNSDFGHFSHFTVPQRILVPDPPPHIEGEGLVHNPGHKHRDGMWAGSNYRASVVYPGMHITKHMASIRCKLCRGDLSKRSMSVTVCCVTYPGLESCVRSCLTAWKTVDALRHQLCSVHGFISDETACVCRSSSTQPVPLLHR